MVSEHTTSPRTRPGQRWFLILAAVLFAAWIAWLAYLVVRTTRPIVLSRPQFLISNLDVIAEVANNQDTTAIVREVHWPTTEDEQAWVGKTVTVSNLSDAEGWQGPGLYILPLASEGKNSFQVTRTPPSPGFDPAPSQKAGRPRIYPVTEQTRWQLSQIRKEAVIGRQ